MVIRSISLKPTKDALNGEFDGDDCHIIGNADHFFQVYDPDTGIIITITDQVQRLENPLTFNNGCLSHYESLPIIQSSEQSASEET